MTAANNVVAVAVGVIRNSEGQLLVSYRNKNQHSGECWEFPGGKIEANETPLTALTRELEEELGIIASIAEPMMDFQYQYPDKAVHLHVFTVTNFTGTPHGQENQPLKWVDPADLSILTFPTANKPIIKQLTQHG